MAIFQNPFRKVSDQEIESLVMKVITDPKNAATAREQLAKNAKRDPVRVLTTIIRFQHSIYSKEVTTWKTARAEAKDIHNPRRVLLTDLYEDIELDGFIHGIVHNKRIFKISNKPFKICGKDGNELPEKTSLFRHQWFNDFLKYAMQSRFYGHSLVYFYEWSGGEIARTEIIPRRHVIPDKHIWTTMQYDINGFDYTQPPFSQYMIGCGREDDLGLYEKAALLYIIKKHSWQSWDEFEERFGIPIPIVETATSDKKTLDAIEKWLRDLSTGSYGIVPEGGKLNIVETGRADTWQIFFRKIEMAQQELEVLFTGQVRETNRNGTYGKEAIKESEAQELVLDDKTFVANLINDRLIPLLRSNGYALADGDYFDWNDGEQASPKDRLEIFKGVKELGFKLDLKQVSEDLDVIITGEEEGEPDPEKKPKVENLIPAAIIEMHKKINELYHHVQ